MYSGLEADLGIFEGTVEPFVGAAQSFRVINPDRVRDSEGPFGASALRYLSVW